MERFIQYQRQAQLAGRREELGTEVRKGNNGNEEHIHELFDTIKVSTHCWLKKHEI